MIAQSSETMIDKLKEWPELNVVQTKQMQR